MEKIERYRKYVIGIRIYIVTCLFVPFVIGLLCKEYQLDTNWIYFFVLIDCIILNFVGLLVLATPFEGFVQGIPNKYVFEYLLYFMICLIFLMSVSIFILNSFYFQ